MSVTSSRFPGIPAARRGTSSLPHSMGSGAKNIATAQLSLVEALRNLHLGPLVFHEVVRLGDAALPALESLLRGSSDAIHQPRCLAADALAAIGSSAAVQVLIRALLDSVARDLSPVLLEAEGILVNHIAEHLSRFPRPEVTEALLSALRRKRYPYCAAALGLTGDPRAIPLLLDCLGEDAARPAAAAALRRFGLPTLLPLANILSKPQSDGAPESPSRLDGRVAAARLLGDFARPGSRDASFAIAALVKALSDRQRSVRVEAALGLVRSGARGDEDVVRILVAALDEENWARAEEITTVLIRVGPKAERLLIPIIGLHPRDEADRRRRVRAVDAVGRLGSIAAVGVLRGLHGSRDTTLRFATVKALASIGSSDASSLAVFLNDPHPTIRVRALQALVRRRVLDPKLAICLLADEDSDVRSLATSAVRSDIVAALPSLKRAASHWGAPVEGIAPRLRLWWHACALIAEVGRASGC